MSGFTGGLPNSAVKDKQGRFLCYGYANGTCNDPNCKRYHGPETTAMRLKRAKDEAKIARAKARGEKASQSDLEDSATAPRAKGKAATYKGQAQPMG